MPHTDKWVIIFLIYADFRTNDKNSIVPPFLMNEEMKTELDCMFKDILTTPINPDKARLFVIMDRINYEKEDNNPIYVASKTIRYEIINPEFKTFNDFGDCIIEDSNETTINQNIPGQPFHRAGHLAKILEETKVREEEKVFFITWDHGSAFGIFREETSQPPLIREVSSITEELSRFPYLQKFWVRALKEEELSSAINKATGKKELSVIQVNHKFFKLPADKDLKFFKKMVYDVETTGFFRPDVKKNAAFKSIINSESINTDDTVKVLEKFLKEEVTEILSNKELAEVFRLWLGTKKVSVLLMMNCWMMNIHTMYGLQDHVSCLVAPQGIIANPGYNYKDILKYCYKQRYIPLSAQVLASKCVETCENKKAMQRAKMLNKIEPKTIKKWKVFAMDLEKLDGKGESIFKQQIVLLKELFTGLISLMNAEPELKYMLKYVRLLCFNFSNSNSCMVDIVNWLISMQQLDDRNMRFKLGALSTPITNLELSVISTPTNNSLVIATSKGKAVYNKKNKISAIVPLNPTGYSIFFPVTNIDNVKILSLIQEDKFLNETSNDDKPSNDWKKLLVMIGENISF